MVSLSEIYSCGLSSAAFLVGNGDDLAISCYAFWVHFGLPPFLKNLIATPLRGMAMYKNGHEKPIDSHVENQSAMY